MTRVAIALGSNLGDREQYLRQAADRVAAFIHHLRLSSFHDTEAVSLRAQPRFLNAAAVGETELTARALLDSLLAVEHALGRTRPYPASPRTIDLDLVFYDDAVIDEPGLTVPHPRFRERRFVLAPLSEVAPDWVDPVTGKRVSELLEALPASPEDGRQA
jgi:2-amino-4-hydroxy-6-hydroxymethyldihydropteridine diphosphokinase